jgi:hypothetical protein
MYPPNSVHTKFDGDKQMMIFCCTSTTERNAVGYQDDEAQGLLLFSDCPITLHPHPACANQPKAVVTS